MSRGVLQGHGAQGVGIESDVGTDATGFGAAITEGEAEDIVRETKEKAASMLHETEHMIANKRAEIAAAVEAGKEAIKEQRAKSSHA